MARGIAVLNAVSARGGAHYFLFNNWESVWFLRGTMVALSLGWLWRLVRSTYGQFSLGLNLPPPPPQAVDTQSPLGFWHKKDFMDLSGGVGRGGVSKGSSLKQSSHFLKINFWKFMKDYGMGRMPFSQKSHKSQKNTDGAEGPEKFLCNFYFDCFCALLMVCTFFFPFRTDNVFQFGCFMTRSWQQKLTARLFIVSYVLNSIGKIYCFPNAFCFTFARSTVRKFWDRWIPR